MDESAILRFINPVKIVKNLADKSIETFARNSPGTDSQATNRFFVNVIDHGTEVTAEVGVKPQFKHMLFFNDGTLPHRIEGNPLAWRDRYTQQMKFARFVIHPGIKSTHWIEDSKKSIFVLASAEKDRS
jgi:hypothetical protein